MTEKKPDMEKEQSKKQSLGETSQGQEQEQEQEEEQQAKEEVKKQPAKEETLQKPQEAETNLPQGTDSKEVASSLSSELGNIRISDSIVAKTSGMAASGVEGVAGMSSGSGIAEAFGKKNVGRGIKVEVGQQEAVINLYMIMNYGVMINKVAREVQQKVKAAVEDLTGLQVKEVNVHVQGVQMPAPEPEDNKLK